MIISLILSIFLRHKNEYKNLWLIMELPKEARDNGYWLYKYIVENQHDINVRYVLSKDSPDYAKMPAKENIIEPYSWNHYILYILCNFSLSTHIYGTSPGRYYSKIFKPFMLGKKEVFLQHGITKEVIPLRGFSGWTIIVSPSEIQHLIKSGHKKPERMMQIGFPRFDSLNDSSKKQNQKVILVMPTFRSWLGGHTTVEEVIFLQSEFYRKWSAFLSNKKMIAYLKKNNYKIIFYPHRQMQKFAYLFETDDEYTEVATLSSYDLQELLRKASLLVTDYSSVFYDFSYMKKPVIFYPFDKEKFYSKHHKYSGSLYPFGEYAENEDSLIDSIIYISKNNFKISKKAEKDIDDFFIHSDTRNCERNFYAIRDLRNE